MQYSKASTCALLFVALAVFGVSLVAIQTAQGIDQSHPPKKNLGSKAIIGFRIYRVYEDAVGGRVQKPIAFPTIVVESGEEFSVPDHLLPTRDVAYDRSPGFEKWLQHGIQISGKIESITGNGNCIPITLEITDSMLTDHDEHSTTMVAVQGIKLQSSMKFIEHKKFKVSDTLWCDVRIDKYD